MVDIKLWYYLKFDSRILRFERTLNLSAVPFVGAEIKMESDHHTIGRVVFEDGGGITAISQDEVDSDGEEMIMPDSKIEDTIEEMKSFGWTLLSNVERKYS
jgi:hypothetical protein